VLKRDDAAPPSDRVETEQLRGAARVVGAHEGRVEELEGGVRQAGRTNVLTWPNGGQPNAELRAGGNGQRARLDPVDLEGAAALTGERDDRENQAESGEPEPRANHAAPAFRHFGLAAA